VNHFCGMPDVIFSFCVISKSDQRIIFITMNPTLSAKSVSTKMSDSVFSM